MVRLICVSKLRFCDIEVSACPEKEGLLSYIENTKVQLKSGPGSLAANRRGVMEFDGVYSLLIVLSIAHR